jgi:paraquat-inducible protein A
VQCRNDLERTSGRSITAALACSIATLLLLFPVNMLPLLRMTVFSFHSDTVISVGISRLWHHGWIILAGLSAIYVVGLPFARFGLVSTVLGAIRLGRRPRWLGPAFRWRYGLWHDIYAMLDVFLLAACIGYYRLIDVHQAQISIGIGGECFIAAAWPIGPRAKTTPVAAGLPPHRGVVSVSSSGPTRPQPKKVYYCHCAL